jgi:hypothetical protein
MIPPDDWHWLRDGFQPEGREEAMRRVFPLQQESAAVVKGLTGGSTPSAL